MVAAASASRQTGAPCTRARAGHLSIRLDWAVLCLRAVIGGHDNQAHTHTECDTLLPLELDYRQLKPFRTILMDSTLLTDICRDITEIPKVIGI